jgi:NCAIR mutase (PurE)-related protein
LAGVIAGLVKSPVIALPTSVGYGASFGGLAALMGMLTSCAPGISVVNIDNGFGAGYQANLINRISGACYWNFIGRRILSGISSG